MVDPDTSFTIIQPYTNRFTHVDVSLGKENVNQFTKLFQQSVWHDLRSLKLKHPADAFDVDLFPLQVPPHLHTLDLSEVMPLTWDIPELFRNLRTLKLTASHAAAMKITLPVFLDVLDACVVLESFSLTILSDHSSMSPDNYRPAHPLRLVRLNSLSYLCLDICRYQDVEHLMLHLVIPESTHVHLSFGDSFAKVNPLHCFNSTSHSHLRFLEAMTSIRISRNKYFSILMSASHDGHTDQPCFTSQVGRREVYMDPWVLGSLLEVGTVFPHSRLTKLELYFSSQHLRNITRKNWIAVLPHLPHLTTLRLARAPPSTTDYRHSKEESEDIDPDCGILDDSEYYIPLLTALVVPQSITHRPTLVPFLRRLDFEDPVPLSDGLKLAMYQCVVSRRAMLADPAQFQLTVGGSASRE
ncbi:hypothetical protein EUX98_g2504 [Antrodiella citrinella]|uniref:F-box domain-containing protein n=1 Tax=Antrodiella citrinella TaxID=2447956 RepID=A0A4S4MYV5_9APHY|nr:hypothetical protein EUX98_g2504 [Antrodiella citrinella]